MGITVWRKIAFNCSSFTCNCLTFSLRRWLFSALCLFRIRKAVDFLLQLYLTQWINPFVFIFLVFFFFCYCYVLLLLCQKHAFFSSQCLAGKPLLAKQCSCGPPWPRCCCAVLSLFQNDAQNGKKAGDDPEENAWGLDERRFPFRLWDEKGGRPRLKGRLGERESERNWSRSGVALPQEAAAIQVRGGFLGSKETLSF